MTTGGIGARPMPYYCMADGQIVEVETERLGEGEPMLERYIVAEPNPDAAERIIMIAMSLLDERVRALGPIPETQIRALGLQPGGFIHA